MANFYVSNYTEKEFKELDNKVLLLSKEKIYSTGVKFNDYNPIIDTKKIICSISYNDPKVNYIIYDDIENVKSFDEFLQELKTKTPKLARIDSIDIKIVDDNKTYNSFEIIERLW